MFRRKLTTILTTLVLSLFLVAPVDAQDPYLQPDDTWISLSGTVQAVTPHTFTLDYGDGLIVVEMDDWDMDADAFKVMKGDKVSVFGAIDDDFFETTTIEASSVFVENLGTYFFASSADEEDTFLTLTTPVVEAATVFQGTVTSVSLGEFTIDTGITDLTVEVDEMEYNPLDDEGFQKIEVGDYVSVAGEFNNDIFEGREFDATSITTIIDAEQRDLSMN